MVPRASTRPVFLSTKPISKILLVLFFAVTFFQCRSAPYYEQAINGQMDILSKRQPISKLVEDPDTPAALRKKLQFIISVRAFAEKSLQLPVKDHYLSYVALDRPYVVWNVFAAPEFSLEPRTWCFPIVGCVAYRGYFAEADARRFGNSLQQEGYDVFIGGAIAYSTLGWFDDPVLSTFTDLSEPDTAALIFHELAHGVMYIKDDTAFNESFATAVEQEGLKRWQNLANATQVYEDWLGKQHQRQKFTALVSQFRARLLALYERDLPLTAKREQKAAVFTQMQTAFRQLKSDQAGLAVYDAWFNRPLNNAQLISVSTYHNWVPAFSKILTESSGDLNKFYQKCRQLAQKAPSERERILTQYLQNASSAEQRPGAVE